MNQMFLDRLNTEVDSNLRLLRRSISDYSTLSQRIDDEQEDIRLFWRRVVSQSDSVLARLRLYSSNIYTIEVDSQELAELRESCQGLICHILSKCLLLAEAGLDENSLVMRSRARQGLAGLTAAMAMLPRKFPTPAAAFIITRFDQLLAEHSSTPSQTSVMRRHIQTLIDRLI